MKVEVILTLEKLMVTVQWYYSIRTWLKCKKNDAYLWSINWDQLQQNKNNET